MATEMDRNYLRDNLLDDDDSPPEMIRAPPKRQNRLSRRSSKRNVPWSFDAIGHQDATAPSNATTDNQSVPSPPSAQQQNQNIPQHNEGRPQEAFRQHVPIWQQNSSQQPRPPVSQAAAPQQDDTGRLNRSAKRLVIAIDYGTTYTGFAYALVSSDEAVLKDIIVLQDWTLKNGRTKKTRNLAQAIKMDNLRKVRSLISYSKPTNGEAQWGSDISDVAVSIVNTKLELEPRETLLDELDMTLHVLKGTHFLAFEKLPKDGTEPEYPGKSPTEIVTDYLTKVYACVQETLAIYRLSETKTSVDIVVTVPVNWSYDATNSTFRAVRAAGFNKSNFPTLKDTILVSEPEAASYFTAQDLHDEGDDFLETDDCFIVCDAGGGTVDVVSLQVKKIISQVKGVSPYLEVGLVTKPTTDKCGSSFIDTAFKRWLRDLLGSEAYGLIDPANKSGRFSVHTVESGSMRGLIEQFEERKKTFSNAVNDFSLRLPEPLNRTTIPGRGGEGELIIYRDDMKKFINPCVNGLIRLIQGQIDEVVNVKNRRVKNVFVVGGFGASPYLQEELKKALRRRNITMRRPDPHKSLTAVVQGGVIYGIEKNRHKSANCMSAAGKSYGIVINGRFNWLIRRGDVLLSQQKREAKSESFWISQDEVSKTYTLPVYTYRHSADDDVPSLWKEGRHEVEQVSTVKCDFSRVHDQDMRVGHMHGNAKYWNQKHVGPLKCHLQLSPSLLEVKVLCGRLSVGEDRVKIPTK